MSRSMRRHELPANSQRLVALMQQINFGRLEALEVRDGKPVLDPCPVIVRDHKFGSEDKIRKNLVTKDFTLKQQVVELFDFFDQIGNGNIDVLEIKHGLPFRMIRKESAA